MPAGTFPQGLNLHPTANLLSQYLMHKAKQDSDNAAMEQYKNSVSSPQSIQPNNDLSGLGQIGIEPRVPQSGYSLQPNAQYTQPQFDANKAGGIDGLMALLRLKSKIPDLDTKPIESWMQNQQTHYKPENVGNTAGVWILPPNNGEPSYKPLYTEQQDITLPERDQNNNLKTYTTAGQTFYDMVTRRGNTEIKREPKKIDDQTSTSMYTPATQDDIEEAAKAVANYDADLSTLPRQDKTRILARARQLNPKFNQINYNANKQLKQDRKSTRLNSSHRT